MTGDLLEQVAGLLARAVTLREAFADGDLGYARAVSERLELDLHALGQWLERGPAA
jgi:hypothetical protein